MCQQSALKTNNVASPTLSNTSLNTQQSPAIKRVSFHDSNANTEIVPRNLNVSESQTNVSSAMETIREDPNVRLNVLNNSICISVTRGPVTCFFGKYF